MVAAYLSLLYSISEKPLEYWGKRQTQTGCIRKILDADLLENVIEIQDVQQSNISKTLISCPPDITQLLNIKLPVLVIILKNVGADCRFQVQIIDTNKVRHHFQFHTGEIEKSRNVRDPVICRAKIQLQSGWNKIELNLKTLTETAFKCQYMATQRLEICANCRLRRVYFVDRHYSDCELSAELYQGFLDLYMLKWGIHKVENATQTTNLKHKKTNVKNNKLFSNLLSTHNTPNLNELHYGGKIDNSIMQTQLDNYPREVNAELINNIKTRSNSLVDEFFNREQFSSFPTKDFKDHIILKSYAVPTTVNKSQKKVDKCQDNDLSNLNNFAKNTEEKFSPASMSAQNTYNKIFINQQEMDTLKDNLEEKWTYRYLCEGKHYSKANDMSESNTSEMPKVLVKNDAVKISEIQKRAKPK